MRNRILTICIIGLMASNLHAQESKPSTENKKKQDLLNFEFKADQTPDVYIDGKKYDYEILQLLDQDKIETLNVVKGERAIKEYKAPNGVLVITSKKSTEAEIPANVKKIMKGDPGKEPVVIIDGKVSSQEKLSQILPENVESIEVFKDQKALELYNAPYGAVVVKTKK